MVGVSIGASAPIVSSSPSWTEAKSPAPITTSASADISTSFAAWSRSRCRSLKASSFMAGKPIRSAPEPHRPGRAGRRRDRTAAGRQTCQERRGFTGSSSSRTLRSK